MFNKLQWQQLQEIRQTQSISDIEHVYGKLSIIIDMFFDFVKENMEEEVIDANPFILMMTKLAATAQHCIEELTPIENQEDEGSISSDREKEKIRTKLQDILCKLNNESVSIEGHQKGHRLLRFDYDPSLLDELEYFLEDND